MIFFLGTDKECLWCWRWLSTELLAVPEKEGAVWFPLTLILIIFLALEATEAWYQTPWLQQLFKAAFCSQPGRTFTSRRRHTFAIFPSRWQRWLKVLSSSPGLHGAPHQCLKACSSRCLWLSDRISPYFFGECPTISHCQIYGESLGFCSSGRAWWAWVQWTIDVIVYLHQFSHDAGCP